MNKKRQLLFRTAAIAVILLLAVGMFIIGRGHTVYFDNKSSEYNGKDYDSFYKVAVIKDGEKVAKLADNERGMADLMGQTLTFTLEITDEEGGSAHSHKVTLPVPYSLDGVVINIPQLMAGLPADAYMSEFVPIAQDDDEDEDIITDEFEMMDEM